MERLANLSKERTGEKNPFFGRHHSEENKEKSRKLFGRRVVQYDANTMIEIAIYDSANKHPRNFAEMAKEVLILVRFVMGMLEKMECVELQL